MPAVTDAAVEVVGVGDPLDVHVRAAVLEVVDHRIEVSSGTRGSLRGPGSARLKEVAVVDVRAGKGSAAVATDLRVVVATVPVPLSLVDRALCRSQYSLHLLVVLPVPVEFLAQTEFRDVGTCQTGCVLRHGFPSCCAADRHPEDQGSDDDREQFRGHDLHPGFPFAMISAICRAAVDPDERYPTPCSGYMSWPVTAFVPGGGFG
ncbi:hypothetical protein [Curtobacterium sp. MCJR17_043]|uniref:hypothetical protein n=1 Tax=Curtobacterium sp. MCJR17_043 TaxID=2175660 RepID=UPI0024E03E44|nr:hypothetical protein [Curtobacterium sp. MCJR17_043]WIB36707.1 hypothetical protein DEJ15_06520 [Curtobacterium sp. MCJR17_043]